MKTTNLIQALSETSDEEHFLMLYEKFEARVEEFLVSRLAPYLRSMIMTRAIADSAILGAVQSLREHQMEIADGTKFRAVLFAIAQKKLTTEIRYHHRSKRDIRKTSHVDFSSFTDSRRDHDIETLALEVKEVVSRVLGQEANTTKKLIADLYFFGLLSPVEISAHVPLSVRMIQLYIASFREAFCIEWDRANSPPNPIVTQG